MGRGNKKKQQESNERSQKAPRTTSKARREERKRMAHETVEIIETGDLMSQSIAHLIRVAVEGTRSYPEGAPIPRPLELVVVEEEEAGNKWTSQFSVVNTTTLDAAERLTKEYPDQQVAVLNFASAKNAGGGFLNGSLAQEESLALHSGLYACLKNDKMYAHHRTMKGGVYTDWCIFSPSVPVFRKESDGSLLLDDPWLMSVITCPCLNKSVVTDHTDMTEKDLEEALRKRMVRMLSVLAAHHSGNVVLGAWGCGVFGNDPYMIAQLFAKIIQGTSVFRNRWPHVVFAVLDSSENGSTIRPFLEVFGGQACKDKTHL